MAIYNPEHRTLSAALIAVALLSILMMPRGYAVQDSKIALSFSNDKPLRGEVLRVSGRLSTLDGDAPIPLATVRLQYHRLGESEVVRDVTMVTSNPGGVFEDLVNTTYLLRIGTWVVNASFAAQLNYQSSFTEGTFTVVVQPTISLYVSTHSVSPGGNVTFNGLLFACIPCIHDEVTVILTRPDNTSVTLLVPVNATGGPYPGGYYAGAFVPDMPGRWAIRAQWNGNDVTLPARSQVEELDVVGPNTVLMNSTLYAAASIIAVASVVVLLLYRRERFGEARVKGRGRRRALVLGYTSAFVGILNFKDLSSRSLGAGRSPI